MAIPVIPLVLIGIGVFALRRRRHASKSTDEQSPTQEPIQTVVFIPPQSPEPSKDPDEHPGQPCATPEGKGAWDDLGECKTFWIDGVTDEAIGRLAREEWEARGRPGFSDLCLAVYDEMNGEFGTHGVNPRFSEIVVDALQRYYDVGPVFPPTETHGGSEPTSPYWVHEAWARANHVVRQELCGG